MLYVTDNKQLTYRTPSSSFKFKTATKWSKTYFTITPLLPKKTKRMNRKARSVQLVFSYCRILLKLNPPNR